MIVAYFIEDINKVVYKRNGNIYWFNQNLNMFKVVYNRTWTRGLSRNI